MGTRADFYVGRGSDAEWLGSIAWDGYPSGIPDGLLLAGDEAAYRTMVGEFFGNRDDVTMPEMGWPWPWETSHTTDYAYAFDAGTVWASCFGEEWWHAIEDCDHDDDRPTLPAGAFPDMRERMNVQFGGKRSGLLIITAPINENGSE